jgi:SPOR domain
MKRKQAKKRHYANRIKSSQKTNRLTWLVSGIIIGLMVPALFLLFLSHANKGKTHLASDMKFDDGNIQKAVRFQNEAIKPRPIKKEATTQAQYEFYNLLSSSEESKSNDNKTTSKYFLHIATFDRFIDADQLKAKLLLTGIDGVSVSKNILGKRVVYKVIAGPFMNQKEANTVSQQLKENSIESTLIEE